MLEKFLTSITWEPKLPEITPLAMFVQLKKCFKIFESQPYLTGHVTRTEQNKRQKAYYFQQRPIVKEFEGAHCGILTSQIYVIIDVMTSRYSKRGPSNQLVNESS